MLIRAVAMPSLVSRRRGMLPVRKALARPPAPQPRPAPVAMRRASAAMASSARPTDLRVYARPHGPGAGGVAGIEAAVDVVGQAELLAHLLTQATHHAELAPDDVRQVSRVVVGAAPLHAEEAPDDVYLGLVWHHGGACAGGVRKRYRRELPAHHLAGRGPVAQVARDRVDRRAGVHVADDEHEHVAGVVVGTVEALDILGRHGADLVHVAGDAVVVGMRGRVKQLAEAARGDVAGVVVELEQVRHVSPRSLRNSSAGKARVAQHIGHGASRLLRVLHQALADEAGGVPAGAHAEPRHRASPAPRSAAGSCASPCLARACRR